MKLIKKYKYIITIILILLIILYVIITKKKLNDNANSDFSILSENPSVEQTQINNKEPESLCSIDIKGAIKKPGVYEANCNSIVNDIIKYLKSDRFILLPIYIHIPKPFQWTPYLYVL